MPFIYDLRDFVKALLCARHSGWGYDQNKKLIKILVLIELTLQWWKVSPKLTNIKCIVFQMMRNAEKKVKEEREVGRLEVQI